MNLQTEGTKATVAIADYIQNALTQPCPKPPKDTSSYKGYRGNGIWGQFKTPEERSQYARELVAQRKTKGGGRPVGVPHGWSKEQITKARELAEQEAAIVVSSLINQGQLEADDRLASERLKEALVTVRLPGQTRRRLAVAKRLLKSFGCDLGVLQ